MKCRSCGEDTKNNMDVCESCFKNKAFDREIKGLDKDGNETKDLDKVSELVGIRLKDPPKP